MAKFSAHSVEFKFLDETGTPITPVVIGAITAAGHPLNTDTVTDDSGGLYDETRAISQQLPLPTYTTKSIQDALAVMGLTGQCFSSDGPNPGVRLYGQVIADCKDNPAATANLRYTIPDGLIVPLSLTVPRVGDATLNFAIHAISDGTNAPFSGDYAAITLPTTAVSNQYGIGHFKVGGILWTEPTGWTLDFGITIDDKLPGIGAVWAETVGVRKSQPVINVTGQDPTILDAAKIPLLGKDALHADTRFQLKKRRKKGSGYESDVSTVHFGFTADGVAIIDDPFSSSGDSVAELNARLETLFDGTNAPIVFEFDRAYSPTAAA